MSCLVVAITMEKAGLINSTYSNLGLKLSLLKELDVRPKDTLLQNWADAVKQKEESNGGWLILVRR